MREHKIKLNLSRKPYYKYPQKKEHWEKKTNRRHFFSKNHTRKSPRDEKYWFHVSKSL